MKFDTTARIWTIKEHWDYDTAEIDVTTDKFEELWLPVLGPSVTALVRYCARQFQDGEFHIEPCELAYQLGLGGRSAKATFGKALQRAERFGMVEVLSPIEFEVPTSVPHPHHSERRRQRVRELFGAKVAS